MRYIAILGTPISAGNRGVIALGSSLIGLCARLGHPSLIRLMIGHHRREKVRFRVSDGTLEVEVVNCRLPPRTKPTDNLAWVVFACLLYRILPLGPVRRGLSRLTPWIKTLEEADLVGDIRGGDSFSDIYGMERFITGFFMAWTAVLVKGRLVQFPQTFGPFQRPISRWMARYLLRYSFPIIARDKESQGIAQELVGIDREVLLCPDVAFTLEPSKPDDILMEPPLEKESEVPRSLIGLNVNGLMYAGGYTRDNMFGLKMEYAKLIPKLIEALLGEGNTELWLLPHTYAPPGNVESDNEACRRVREALPGEIKQRVRIVTGEYDCHELKWLIGQCDFFIGSRMHSCIAALSQGVPCVGIAYSRKFRGVFETVGMGDWVVDGREVGTDEAVGRVLELYRRRDEVREPLKEEARKAKLRVEETFRELFRRLSG
ncbi:MAG: polysaccharide pyruvyl transferase family protein [bacterium]